MSLEEKLAQAKLRQKKGEMVEAAEEAGVKTLRPERPGVNNDRLQPDALWLTLASTVFDRSATRRL